MSSNNNVTDTQPSSSSKVDVSLVPNIIAPLMPLLNQVYTDLASPGVKKVGMALETVLDLGYTFLAMPLQNVSKKRKLVIERNFELYKKKMESVNEEDVVEVSPELGIPLLQKLTYVSNSELAEFFVNLLTSASSLNTCNSAHPGFLKIIESISVDEARILNYLAKEEGGVIPFICFVGKLKDIADGIYELTTRLTDVRTKTDLLTPNNDHIYMDNLISLGLMELDNSFLTHKGIYDELEILYKDKKAEFEGYISDNSNSEFHGKFSSLEVSYGHYAVTSFAQEFFRACVENSVYKDVTTRF